MPDAQRSHLNALYLIFAVTGVGVVYVIARFGGSKSSLTGGSGGVSLPALQAVLAASVAKGQQDTDLQTARIKAASQALVDLKTLEEQVRLGEISLQDAQLKYAAATEQARITAGAQESVAQTFSSAAVQEAQLQEQAVSNAASSQAHASILGSFWSTIGNLVSKILPFKI